MSIKQAIEALELAIETSYSDYTNVKFKAAIAALRSVPQGEPVATLWVQMETHDMGQSLAPNPPFKVAIAKAHTAAKDLPLGEYLLFATPPTEAVRMSDQEIDAITDQQWRDKSDTPIYAAYRSYARAIEQAIGRASRGAK